MSQVDIAPVRTRRQRNDFVRLPRWINQQQTLWVPTMRRDALRQIDPQTNPFYEHAERELFLAYQEDQAVGRIAAIHNHLHDESWNDQVGFFGHFETIDDPEVSGALFAAAADWLAARGLCSMRGPTNPSMNANCGLLADGLDFSPTIPMPYTHRFYLRHVERFGFRPVMDLRVYGWNFRDHLDDDFVLQRHARLRRLCNRVRQRGEVEVRRVRTDRIEEELEFVRTICNRSLKDNWGYVPLTSSEMHQFRKELQFVIDPELFNFALVDGIPESVFIACPDYNQLIKRMNGRLWPTGWLTYLRYRRRINKYVVYVYAATPRADAVGAGLLLYERFFQQCEAQRIGTCETGFVLENNARMRNTIEKYGARLRKIYRMYEKRLS